jgi:pyruvate-ferredoxin/flavodoxin oxidoreductase
LREFTQLETRFKMLEKSQPERARELAKLAQKDVDSRWKLYEHMAQPYDGNGKDTAPKPAAPAQPVVESKTREEVE